MDEPRALSLRNPKVQHLRRLTGRRRSRLEEGRFTFEGATLLADAIASAFAIEAVFVDESAHADLAELLDSLTSVTPVHVLAPGVLAKVADTTSPQGVIALARRPVVGIDAVLGAPEGWIVVLDGIGDPGNAGTIVRTAEAFGARAAVFAGAGADPFGPKTVRASAGSAFRLPLVEHDDAADAVRRLLDAGFAGFATVVSGGRAPDAVDLTGASVIVLGSEPHGVGQEVQALPLHLLTIPMLGAVESLNVASTAAVLGYERNRQLGAAGPQR